MKHVLVTAALLSLALVLALSSGVSISYAADGPAQSPTVAYNSNQGEYLAVWAAGNSLIGQRLFNFGTPLAEPFAVYTSSQHLTAPAAIFDAGRNVYIVFWNENGLLRRRFLDTAGRPTFGNPSTIARGIGSDAQPAVTFVPDQSIFLVAWVQNGSLYTLRIDRGAKATLGRPVEIAHAVNVSTAPALVYNSSQGEHLIVWNNGHQLLATRLYPDGTPITPNITVVSAVTAAADPALVLDTVQDRYLLVWNQGADLIALKLDLNGNPVFGPATVAARGVGTQAAPTVAFNSAQDEFLVVFASRNANAGQASVSHTDGGMSLFSQRLFSEGTPIGR